MLSARRGLPSEAGRKASEKVVREGELPAKYRPAARKYVAPVLFANPQNLFVHMLLSLEFIHICTK